MNNVPETHRRLFSITILTMIFAFFFGPASTATIPKNATAKPFGSGWECNSGFTEVNKVCEVINVPKKTLTRRRCGMDVVGISITGSRMSVNAVLQLKCPRTDF